MALHQLNFEPYAVRLRISILEGNDGASINRAVSELISVYSRLCASETDALIGHIKGYAELPDGSYLRFSVSGEERTFDFEGITSKAVDSLMLSLNVHVLGVRLKRLEKLLDDAITAISSNYNVTICIFEHA